MNTDSRQQDQQSAESQQHNGGAVSRTQAKHGGKKATATSRAQKQVSNGETTRTELAETQAALAEMRSRLAAVEAALVEERQKTLAAKPRPTESPSPAPVYITNATVEEASFGMMPFVGFRGTDLFGVGQQVIEQAVKHPPLALKHYTNFLMEMGRIWTGQSKVEPEPKDKRFADEVWKTNPFYHMYLQTYLTWRESLGAFINEAELGKKDAERARFVLSLFTEAVSPTNTLLGNPAAMKKMYETGGASLVRGLTHMIEDLANNGGLPSQVDMKAFQIGEDIAITSGAVVFKNEVLELIQYQPTTPVVYRRPLVLVPPQVNKFYVMDLSPNKSLIRYLVNNGFQVFTISWRNPTVEHRDWGFETYDKAIMEAIDAARAITGSEDVNITGSCLGGMTLATLLGHLAATGDKRVNAVTFLVTVLDSDVESTMGLFATKETIQAARQTVRIKGVLEGQEMARIFAWLRPNDLIWNYWVNNYLIGNDPAAFDVLFWNNDTTRLPAQLHSDLLDVLEENLFRQQGKLTILGTPIDLKNVTNETYIVAGITDHITPWQGVYATTQLLGGPVKFILSNSGHIQALLNPPGNPKASYFVNDVYPSDPEQWLAAAKKQQGSWWDDWREWLGQRSGEQKPVPTMPGNEQYLPGTPAPGAYVFEP